MAMVHDNPMRQKSSPDSHSQHPDRPKEHIHLNPAHKGLLHEELHVPQGQPIPHSKLEQALHSTNPAERKRAVFAENFGH